MSKPVLTIDQVRQGGETTKKRYGREHYVKAGKIRAANMKKDPDYFKRLSAAGVAARKRKKEALAAVDRKINRKINKSFKFVTGNKLKKVLRTVFKPASPDQD